MPALKNEKHEIFASLVAKGLSGRQAYIDAGYSPNGADGAASKLQKTAKVAARIAELREKVANRVIEKTAISKEWVLAELVDNVKKAKAAEPVRNKDGEEIGEYRANFQAANTALHLIGKELGMFVEKAEIKTGKLEDKTDEELDAIIAQAAKHAGVGVTLQ